jgi:hypothetical protein
MASPKHTELRSLRLKRFERDLRAAIREDNDQMAKDLLFALDMADLTVDSFPEKQFHLLCSVMHTRSFRRSKKAARRVLDVFRRDQCENLSKSQKRRLLSEIEWLYPKITTSASQLCFLMTVLLGECFRDEGVLNLLIRLSGVPRENSRSLIPHGLEHIVHESGDKSLAAVALDKLRRMAADPSAQVRGEVALSMARIREVSR